MYVCYLCVECVCAYVCVRACACIAQASRISVRSWLEFKVPHKCEPSARRRRTYACYLACACFIYASPGYVFMPNPDIYGSLACASCVIMPLSLSLSLSHTHNTMFCLLPSASMRRIYIYASNHAPARARCRTPTRMRRTRAPCRRPTQSTLAAAGACG